MLEVLPPAASSFVHRFFTLLRALVATVGSIVWIIPVISFFSCWTLANGDRVLLVELILHPPLQEVIARSEVRAPGGLVSVEVLADGPRPELRGEEGPDSRVEGQLVVYLFEFLHFMHFEGLFVIFPMVSKFLQFIKIVS